MARFLKITRFLYYPSKGNDDGNDENKYYYSPALSLGKIEKIAHMLLHNSVIANLALLFVIL